MYGNPFLDHPEYKNEFKNHCRLSHKTFGGNCEVFWTRKRDFWFGFNENDYRKTYVFNIPKLISFRSGKTSDNILYQATKTILSYKASINANSSDQKAKFKDCFGQAFNDIINILSDNYNFDKQILEYSIMAVFSLLFSKIDSFGQNDFKSFISQMINYYSGYSLLIVSALTLYKSNLDAKKRQKAENYEIFITSLFANIISAAQDENLKQMLLNSNVLILSIDERDFWFTTNFRRNDGVYCKFHYMNELEFACPTARNYKMIETFVDIITSCMRQGTIDYNKLLEQLDCKYLFQNINF